MITSCLSNSKIYIKKKKSVASLFLQSKSAMQFSLNSDHWWTNSNINSNQENMPTLQPFLMQYHTVFVVIVDR